MTDQPEFITTKDADEERVPGKKHAGKPYTGRRLLTPGHQRQMHGGISGVTHWRWQNDPDLNYPPPIVINGIPYRWSDELEAWCESFRVTESNTGKVDAA